MSDQLLEAINVIEASNLTRSELAKFREDPYMLGLVDYCRFKDKPLCARKHKHCVLTTR